MSEKISPERLIQYFRKDEFARYVGCEIVEAAEGMAKVRMEIRPHHLNGVGLLHGGAIFTAADLAAAVAANSHGRVAVAVSCTVIYMKPASGKAIVATAREISRSRKIAAYEVNVVDEQSCETVASFQGTAYRMDKDISYFERQGGPEA
jgi:acyl-CoA thioesterase